LQKPVQEQNKKYALESSAEAKQDYLHIVKTKSSVSDALDNKKSNILVHGINMVHIPFHSKK
jgi:hypothetical protein